MKRTFKSEDRRKDSLFKAWIEHLHMLHSTPALAAVEEIYEGLVTIEEVGPEKLGLKTGEGQRIELTVSKAIGKHSLRDDYVTIAIGRIAEKWWPLDVISVGSIVRGRETGIHFSVNPLYRFGMGRDSDEAPGNPGVERLH